MWRVQVGEEEAWPLPLESGEMAYDEVPDPGPSTCADLGLSLISSCSASLLSCWPENARFMRSMVVGV